MIWDIIPDIHGQSEKLQNTLSRLGYFERKGGWSHSETDRQCIFLGDFIDRGPDNSGVISIVRRMIDSGVASAVMGNHELNAIHFHISIEGTPLRLRDEKNTGQHETFLREFPVGETETNEIIGWMRTLPLYLETAEFRAVHACWNDEAISYLKSVSNSGVLSEEQLIQSAGLDAKLAEKIDITTKGPEKALPDGHFFYDKDKNLRTDVRVRWWKSGAKTWDEIAMSVPDTETLPTSRLPDNLQEITYSAEAKPVFFGHYWLTGDPVLQAPNALCLDYSAGRNGPLVSYTMTQQSPALSLHNLSVN